jgi:hypothetical protein
MLLANARVSSNIACAMRKAKSLDSFWNDNTAAPGNATSAYLDTYRTNFGTIEPYTLVLKERFCSGLLIVRLACDVTPVEN